MANRNQWSALNPALGTSSFQYRLSSSARMGAKQKSRSRTESSPQQLCSYIHRICLQNRLDGFNYCIRHILEDKSAPFRQCSYNHMHSGKRCPNAARRTERRDSTLCPWHLKKLYLKRKQALAQQIRQRTEEHNRRNDELKKTMNDLEHYCPNPSHDNRRLAVDWVQLEDQSVTASDHLRRKMAESAANMGACIDTDLSHATLDDVVRSDPLDSDSESVDSSKEEPLKHAGVYAAEEVSLILRDKMLRLQSLYIEEFKRFQYLLKEKKKKYLTSLKLEKDINGIKGISQTVAENECSKQEKEDYQQLKALWRYHRSHGTEALLRQKSNEKRKESLEGAQYRKPVYQTCIFAKGEEVCDLRSLPLSNYCQKRNLILLLITELSLNQSFINRHLIRC